MFKILILIFLGLLLIIGRDRGVVSAITIIGNIIVLIAVVLGMAIGVNPVIVTFLGCVIINCITIFYQNGKNAKTIAAFISVIFIVLLLFTFIYIVGGMSVSGGLNEIDQYSDELAGYNTDIKIDMRSVANSMIIIGLLGAIMDTAVAISSAIYEVYLNNTHLTMAELFLSGFTIGKDILGTTLNTLYFAFIGEGLMLFIWYQNNLYSFSEIINSKSFFQEFECIIFSCIGCMLIVPTAALFTSYVLTHIHKFKKYLDEDELNMMN